MLCHMVNYVTFRSRSVGKGGVMSEKLPFTAWELEIMAAALKSFASYSTLGYSDLSKEQMRKLANRLRLADPNN